MSTTIGELLDRITTSLGSNAKWKDIKEEVNRQMYEMLEQRAKVAGPQPILAMKLMFVGEETNQRRR